MVKKTAKTEDGEKENKPAESRIEETLREIKTKFGDDAIMKLGEKPRVDVNAISTGSILSLIHI